MFRSLALFAIGLTVVALNSCSGAKAKAQEEALNCDVLFEYQAVENDSISLMVGNTIRLHTDKASLGNFYPLMISVRSPENLDKPTSTEFIGDETSLRVFLLKKFPLFKSIGVVIGESALKKPKFSEKDAISPVKSLVAKIPDARLLMFREKGGDIISSESLR